MEAEWNFYATSHVKEACDGLAGSVKRQAYRASLQRDNAKHITNALSLFECIGVGHMTVWKLLREQD